MSHIITDEQTVSVEEYISAVRQTQPALRFPETNDDEPANAGTAILKTLKRQLDRLDIEIDELYEERLIDTANGEHLERIAARYDLDRKRGESDEKLRLRTRAARLVAQSRGTYEDIARVALAVLDTEPEQVNLIRPSKSGKKGTGVLRVSSAALDGTPFSDAELISILSDAAVGGHRITIESGDAFRYGDPANGWGTTWAQVIE